jgi:hypothetical protein
MPGIQDTFADPLLTQYSVKYQNDLEGFICEKIFPQVMVNKKTGFYFTYGKENLRIPSSRRRKFSRANRIEWNVAKTPYGPLFEHSLEDGIEDDLMDQYDAPLEPRQDSVETLTEMLYLEKEYNLAQQLADASIITQNTTLGSTQQWDAYTNANSKPFLAIQTGIDAVRKNSLRAPNTMWMGYPVWSKLINHPDMIDRVKYTQISALTIDMMKSLFPGITNVFIGSAVYNTAKEGQTDATDFVWGKNFWVGYVPGSPKLREPALGYHLQLKAARMIDRWDDRSVKAEFVRITDYYEPKLVTATAAYGIFSAVS